MRQIHHRICNLASLGALLETILLALTIISAPNSMLGYHEFTRKSITMTLFTSGRYLQNTHSLTQKGGCASCESAQPQCFRESEPYRRYDPSPTEGIIPVFSGNAKLYSSLLRSI